MEGSERSRKEAIKQPVDSSAGMDQHIYVPSLTVEHQLALRLHLKH